MSRKRAPNYLTHTPGPWQLHEGEDYIVVMGADQTTDNALARVDTFANAKLIAAAPDLLAVVQAYLGTVGNKKGDPDLADVDDIARKAIAKAVQA